MTAIEKLDTILNFPYNNIGYNFNVDSVEEKLPNFLVGEVYLILEKLLDDKHVIRIEYPLPELKVISDQGHTLRSEYRYSISFTGRMFKEEGGYKVQAKRNKTRANNLRFLNLAIAIGGGVAALYYLIEIIMIFLS